MAANESQLSSHLEAAVHHKHDRRANGTPPTQSKRDKKRQLLTERLATLTEKFSRDRDNRYREQLQKIQIDTNLIMRVDPYAERPLDFLDNERKSVEQTFAAEIDQHARTGGRTLLEMAGPTFQQWLLDVEDLVEVRDYNMTTAKYDFDKKELEHKKVLAYKNGVARREHKALCHTLRDRLINAITSKKVRLTKEKEALEISEASALLLHPNQYSINNPTSPGGAHAKRATRLRQNVDDLSSYGDSRKRKRNGDDDGSPAPSRRPLDIINTTPLWQTDGRTALRRATGPIYSIDKLFTDKELSMTYNQAAVAQHKYILTHKVGVNGNDVAASPSSGSEIGDDDRDVNGLDIGPSSAMMERVPSHATRSTRGGTHNHNFIDERLVGIEALSNFEMPGSLEKLIACEPKMPPQYTPAYTKPHLRSDCNTPSPMDTNDITSDLAVISVLKQYDSIHGAGANLDTENGSRKVLEAAAYTIHDQRYQAYISVARQNDAEDLRKGLKIPTSSTRDDQAGLGLATIVAPAIGASPMSRQSSQGGIAMSRQGSNTRAQRKRN